jgi:O-antigen ligase
VSPVPGLDALGPGVGLLAAAALLALVLWLAWLRPTWVFVVALASLAIRPELVWGGPEIGYDLGLHHSLLVFALLMNGRRFGIWRTVNWPIVAMIVVFILGLALGDLHPQLTVPFMLASLAILALPFAFTQVVLEPGTRRLYGLVIGLCPAISVGLGVALELAGLSRVFGYEEWHDAYRLQGATGNPAVFALLAFAGFAAMLHEATRPNRPYAGYLAALNFAAMLLSGTRMAVLAGVVLLVIYALVSEELRDLWWQRRIAALLGACGILVVGAWYAPQLYTRLFDGAGGQLSLSGRDVIWSFYLEQLWLSPAFGRGFGAGFVAAADWVPWPRKTPHNEYLHLLVTGGFTGFVLILTAIVVWYRHLVQVGSPNDRRFLLALAPAILVFAVTEDVLVFSSGLAMYAYLAVLQTRQGLGSFGASMPDVQPDYGPATMR